MSDYITAANYKTRYAITTTNKDAAPLLPAHITSGSLWVDGYCGRHFGAGTPATVRYFSAYDCDRVRVDDCYTITSVDLDLDDDGTYETNLPAASYRTLPANGVGPNRQTGWPAEELEIIDYAYRFPRFRRPGVKVSATFGWAATPVDVVEATYQVVARLNGEVAVPLGVTAPNVEFGLPGSGIQPPYEIMRLLSQYRRSERAVGVAG